MLKCIHFKKEFLQTYSGLINRICSFIECGGKAAEGNTIQTDYSLYRNVNPTETFNLQILILTSEISGCYLQIFIAFIYFILVLLLLLIMPHFISSHFVRKGDILDIPGCLYNILLMFI